MHSDQPTALPSPDRRVRSNMSDEGPARLRRAAVPMTFAQVIRRRLTELQSAHARTALVCISDPDATLPSVTEDLANLRRAEHAIPDFLVAPLAQAPLPFALGIALSGRRLIVDATAVSLGALVHDLEMLASMRYRTGGTTRVPMVVLARIGGTDSAHYERCQWGALCRIPGLRVAVPATVGDLDAMFGAAERERGPVVLLLHADLLGPPWGLPAHAVTTSLRPSAAPFRDSVTRGPGTRDLPQHDLNPLVRARIVLPGEDVTVVACGADLHLAVQAIRRMRGRAHVELIDLRVVAPWDRDTVLASVEKTGRLVVIDEDGHGFGLAAEIQATVSEMHPAILRAPAQRVTRADVPTAPVAHLLGPTLPTTRAISTAITKTLAASSGTSSASA